MSTIVRLFRGTKDKDRFTELLRPHVELMYRMAYRWAGNQQDAEDVVQAVLIKLASRVEEIAAVENLRPWLIKAVYHRFIDEKRQQARRPEILHSVLSEDSPIDELSGIETSIEPSQSVDPATQHSLENSLNLALAELSPEQRDVILLHDAEGYTALETAEILGVSVGTVKSRLHRSREKLKIFLKDGTF